MFFVKMYALFPAPITYNICMKKYLKPKFLILYGAVFIISLILNWLMQLSYYTLTISQNPHAFLGQRTLLQYYTGVYGDGVIAPLINILAIYFFLFINFKPKKNVVLKMFGLALLTDIFDHLFWGLLKLTNWSMPKPFVWDFSGYWHMVSLPIQMTYLYVYFYAVIVNWEKAQKERSLKISVGIVFGLMLLFLVLFLIDNKWI